MRESNPQTHDEKLAHLRELREAAVHSASEAAVEKQHAKGKLTARERIEKLLDPGSFEELDTFVRHRTYDFEMQKNRPWGDCWELRSMNQSRQSVPGAELAGDFPADVFRLGSRLRGNDGGKGAVAA